MEGGGGGVRGFNHLRRNIKDAWRIRKNLNRYVKPVARRTLTSVGGPAPESSNESTGGFADN